MYADVVMKLRLLVDYIHAIFDIPSAAMAMKEDVWKRFVSLTLSSPSLSLSLLPNFPLLYSLIDSLLDTPLPLSLSLSRCLENLQQLVTLLENHPEISLSETSYDEAENFTVSYA